MPSGVYKRTPEMNRRTSESTEGLKRSVEAKANMKGHSGVYVRTNEHKTNLKKARNRPEVRAKIRKAATENWQDIDIRNRTVKAMTIALNRPEVKAKIKRTIKALWANPEYQKNQSIGQHKRPTNPERIFNELTPDIVRYTGDWQFFITTKIRTHNPDFKVTGQRKIIEIWGDYWHEGENPKELIREYAVVGWECIIFWELEVLNESKRVLKETMEFIN